MQPMDLVLLSLAVLVRAAPFPYPGAVAIPGGNDVGISQKATFEDVSKFEIPGIPVLNPLGVYKNFNWAGFVLEKVGIAGAAPITGIVPTSGSHVAAYAITNDQRPTT